MRRAIRPVQVRTVLGISEPDSAYDVGTFDRQPLASRKLADFLDTQHDAESVGLAYMRVKS